MNECAHGRYNIGHVAIGIGDLGLAYQAFKISISVDANHAESYSNLGVLELRFMASNADIQVGDLLTTSGVDGVYPPGLPVARVSHIERRAESDGFIGV